MKNTEKKTLQTTNVPISVLEKAEKKAQKEGFSSIQEVIRLFLENYSSGNIKISLNIVSVEPNPNVPTFRASAETERLTEKAFDEDMRGETIAINNIDELDEIIDKYDD